MSTPARVCNVPGCGEPVTGRNGKCRRCQAKAKREAAKRNGRPRGSQWAKLREIVLKRDPYCKIGVVCGGRAPSTEVDHVLALVEGGHPTDLDNLQGACHDCHVVKTQEEHRRWGNNWGGLKEDM